MPHSPAIVCVFFVFLVGLIVMCMSLALRAGVEPGNGCVLTAVKLTDSDKEKMVQSLGGGSVPTAENQWKNI